MSSSPYFAHSAEQLAALADEILTLAKKAGASDAEVELSESQGQNVSVRMQELESVEYMREKSLALSVYFGKRKGSASTGDFSKDALKNTVNAACDIARFTAEDDCAGLADAEELADAELAHKNDLDLFHPWDLEVSQLIDLAKEIEDAGLSLDEKISNSEGAGVSLGLAQFHYANSRGFAGGGQSSRHSLSASLVAEDASGMQRDYWYAQARAAEDLPSARCIGEKAGERALRRLNARRLSTCQAPVLFAPNLSAGLLGHFIHAVSGGSLYRESSFLLNSLDQKIFADCVQIREDPFIKRALASAYFDNNGVKTQKRQIVENGVLKSYFLSAYSARKLGLKNTGNAGGVHNLLLQSTGESFAELLQKMQRGLFVTELLGQGVNAITGDYSRGAAGFWVEDGAIAFPVEEITIASNLKTMFLNIAAIGNDIEVHGSRQTGSILIQEMMIAGE